MPAPVVNPPAVVQPAEPGMSGVRENHVLPLGPNSELRLHGLGTPDPVTGEITLGGLSARMMGQHLQRATTLPLGQNSFMHSGARPNHSIFSAWTDPALTQPPSLIEQKLMELGIERAEIIMTFQPGQERGMLVTHGELLSGQLEVDRSGVGVAIEGQQLRDLTNWLYQGKGEFSSARLWTNGKEYVLTPSYSLHSVAPGMSATLSANVGSIVDSRNGLRPQFDHLLSGDPEDPNAGLPFANGRLLWNQYSFSGMPSTALSTLDFRSNGLDASVFLGTNMRGYDFVAVRGVGDLFGARFQADGLYTRRDGGGQGFAATLTAGTVIDKTSLNFSLGGYWQSQEPLGYADPAVGGILGVTSGSEYGFGATLELQRILPRQGL